TNSASCPPLHSTIGRSPEPSSTKNPRQHQHLTKKDHGQQYTCHRFDTTHEVGVYHFITRKCNQAGLICATGLQGFHLT
uniref:Uncharacterized protein n=1 Tax=Hippocampus comes TaxID=109280 RepID=A0A3Q2XEV1_HIPCM